MFAATADGFITSTTLNDVVVTVANPGSGTKFYLDTCLLYTSDAADE